MYAVGCVRACVRGVRGMWVGNQSLRLAWYDAVWLVGYLSAKGYYFTVCLSLSVWWFVPAIFLLFFFLLFFFFCWYLIPTYVIMLYFFLADYDIPPHP